jgi:uncharacterized membrane protein YphA (DoxX/SURF4 family)
MEATKANWRAYRDRVANHYGFNEQQNKRSQAILERYEKLLDTFVARRGEDIVTIFRSIERRDRNADDHAMQHVESLRGQSATMNVPQVKGGQTEMIDWRRQRGELLAEVDAMWSGLEQDLNAVADAQRAKADVPIRKIGRRTFDSEGMDIIVPWFDTIIGLCLIVGLFTRFAGVLGAAFLAMIISSQWPGYPGAAATWPQAIECIALLHLAFVGAGQYGGIDGILKVMCTRRYRRKQGT